LNYYDENKRKKILQVEKQFINFPILFPFRWINI